MRVNRKLSHEVVSTGSMADIAFLLLIFFLVSTTILQEKGLALNLPPDQKDRPPMPVNDRNVFNISINSKNQFLVQDQPRQSLDNLKEELKVFILNPAGLETLAESPQKAVISLKTSRGTEYATFISVLDLLKGTYYEIYGERVGLTARRYLSLDPEKPADAVLYEKGREGIPMNISIAEPTR